MKLKVKEIGSFLFILNFLCVLIDNLVSCESASKIDFHFKLNINCIFYSAFTFLNFFFLSMILFFLGFLDWLHLDFTLFISNSFLL